MKTTIFFILNLFTALTINSLAQSPAYKNSQVTENNLKGGFYQRFIGADEDFYFLKVKNYNAGEQKRFFIDKITPELDVVSTELNYSEGNILESNTLQELYRIHNYTAIISSTFDKKNASNTLYLLKSSDNVNISSDKIQLASIPAEKMINKGEFGTYLSPDGNLLYVITGEPYNKDKTSYTIQLKCFETATLKESWSRSFDIGNESQKNVVFSLIGDNSSNLLLNVFSAKGFGSSRQFYHYSHENGTLNELNIGLEEKEIIDSYDLTLSNNGSFILSGFFKNKNSMAIQGRFIVSVEKNGTVSLNHKQNIEEKIYKSLFGDNFSVTDKSGLYAFALKKVEQLPNGNLVYLLEKMTKLEKSIPNTSPPNFERTRTYETILAFCVSPKTGEVIWNNKIDRKASFTTIEALGKNLNQGPFDSFVSFANNDNINIIYNNSELNNVSEWKDGNGLYEKRAIYGNTTKYPPFQHILDATGNSLYGQTTFGYPVDGMLKQNTTHPMALYTQVFGTKENTLLLINQSLDGNYFSYSILKF